MSNKQIIVLSLAFIAVLGIIGTTVMLTREPQDQQSAAQTPGGSCPVPVQVQNVQIEFPNCQ